MHGRSIPCLYSTCPCSFKTLRSLRTHLSRYHQSGGTDSEEILFFQCRICKAQKSSEKEYFQHLGHHLRSLETVGCVFDGCEFKTNVYGTFVTHKSRHHNPHSFRDFRADVIVGRAPVSSLPIFDLVSYNEGDDVDDIDELNVSQIIRRCALLLLKLECIYNVSTQCIDDLIEELRFISSLASVSCMRKIVESNLRKHDCELSEESLVEFVDELCNCNPIVTALSGPFDTAHKRRQYFKNQLDVLEPVEYIMDVSLKKTYQYIPVLKTLQKVVNSQYNNLLKESSSVQSGFQSFRDGSYYKENAFFLEDEFQISLIVYVDEFEVCNPLGTSKKKHKITAVYWVLANLPPALRSSLKAINLAVLCKAVDIKRFGLAAILEPFLKDICVLEQNGVYISSFGKNIKGTVLCVVADNLGAHSVGVFVESFTGSFICRFCLGNHADFQSVEVRSGAFPRRTKEAHALHLQTLKENPQLNNCFGVKKQCPLTEKLSSFHVVRGYPLDLAHDLFEGIIPVEIALCLSVLIKKRYITLQELNDAIKNFQYKDSDKTNSPQAIPRTFRTRHTVGGNAHENWALLRLLPFLIGSKIPSDEPVWDVLMVLKEIVELVVSPMHTRESLGYLDSKISEHRHKFLNCFPNERLLPKHHFLEHYPELLEAYGPLLALWSMRFESKHGFFKNVVRHTRNFKNVLCTLATRHQLMMAYYSYTDRNAPSLTVSKVSTVPVDLLHTAVQEVLRDKVPNQTLVELSSNVVYNGVRYRIEMILSCGSTGGLPDFVEISQILILEKSVSFIVKSLCSWYDEHLRSYYLEASGDVRLVEHQALNDWYPLPSYTVAGKCMVTLKRHICISY